MARGWKGMTRGENGKNVQTETQSLLLHIWPITAFPAPQDFPCAAHTPHLKGVAQKTNKTPKTVAATC